MNSNLNSACAVYTSGKCETYTLMSLESLIEKRFPLFFGFCSDKQQSINFCLDFFLEDHYLVLTISPFAISIVKMRQFLARARHLPFYSKQLKAKAHRADNDDDCDVITTAIRSNGLVVSRLVLCLSHECCHRSSFFFWVSVQ